MLTVEEIKQFMLEDAMSEEKRNAAKGQQYYESVHDIKDYRIFYYNDNGELTEDKYRTNYKIPHPFFTELVDQAVQYMLSGQDKFAISDLPELQDLLDVYFNKNEDFKAELSELLTGCMAKGFEYMFKYKDNNNKTAFQCADCTGVIEVRAKDTDSNAEHYIYWYVDRIEKGRKVIKRIQVWDEEEIYFYVQDGEGEIIPDDSEAINPRPHTVYVKDGKEEKYGKSFGYIPFFRLNNNKKKISDLKPIKPLIDDYDLMASSLSNNLTDFDTPIHVVRGFEGDNLEKLQKNLATRRIMGMPDDAEFQVHTVDIPYQARLTKLELDEKNIYRFGMGLNTAGLKDTSATTNIAIKAAYSLLDLKCSKLEIKLKQFLRKILQVVLDEINVEKGTDYQSSQVTFEFTPDIMSNAQENAQIELTEAQRKQTEITTLMNIATYLDNETFMKNICEVLDIDYEEIKSKLPDPNEADTSLEGAGDALTGDMNDEGTEAGFAGTVG